VKLAELSNNSFERKNVTFLGVKTYSDPFYIFSTWIKTPPQDLHFWLVVSRSNNVIVTVIDKSVK